MAEYKKILFPIDLSDPSPQVAAHAAFLGREFGAELHLLYVTQSGSIPFEYAKIQYAQGPLEVKTYQTELFEKAEQKMASFVNQNLKSYPKLKPAVIQGEIRKEIIRYIEVNGISLVVMGSHGRKGLDKMIFGSVAQGVVQLSPVPVMTLNPHQEKEGQGDGTRFNKVLLPVDLSAVFSTSLIDHAVTMAQKFSAGLHLLWVIRAAGGFYGGDYLPNARIESYHELLKVESQQRLEEFAALYLADYPDLKASLATGHTAREILKYILDHGISLVVMGTHGRRGLDRVLFGSVAQRVVQSSPVPVVTLNPYQEGEKDQPLTP